MEIHPSQATTLPGGRPWSLGGRIGASPMTSSFRPAACSTYQPQLWILRQGRQDGQVAPTRKHTSPPPLAPRGAIEAALTDAEDLLLEVGFLLPHTAHARMAKLRALLQRAQLTDNDLSLLRGMVCQLRWASRRGDETGLGP
jgi:hypothetical protein